LELFGVFSVTMIASKLIFEHFPKVLCQNADWRVGGLGADFRAGSGQWASASG
jgi:hypothetical protein